MWLLRLLLFTWCPSVIWKTSKKAHMYVIQHWQNQEIRTGAGSRVLSFLTVGLVGAF